MAVLPRRRTALKRPHRMCSPDNYPFPLLAVTARGLPTSIDTFPEAPLDQDGWDAVLRGAIAHRVSGYLLAAIDAGVLPTTSAQAGQARGTHRSTLLRVLALERELVAVVDLLGTAGIRTRVLKGSAVAHLDYPDPALRPFIDLDIAVPPESMDAAVHTLAAAGFARSLDEPRPGFDRRFDKGVTFRSTSGYGLDLHRTFVLGPWGLRVDLADLWDGSEEFDIGGRSLHALPVPIRMLHACYHAALGDWPLRLISLRDVAQIALGLSEQDGSAVIARAVAWGAEAVVAAAVVDAWRLLGLTAGTALASWSQDYSFTRRDLADLALHTQDEKTFPAQAVSTLRALPGLRDKLAYARALALPDAAYTTGRHPSAMSRFRYAIQEVRRGRATPQ